MIVMGFGQVSFRFAMSTSSHFEVQRHTVGRCDKVHLVCVSFCSFYDCLHLMHAD